MNGWLFLCISGFFISGKAIIYEYKVSNGKEFVKKMDTYILLWDIYLEKNLDYKNKLIFSGNLNLYRIFGCVNFKRILIDEFFNWKYLVCYAVDEKNSIHAGDDVWYLKKIHLPKFHMS